MVYDLWADRDPVAVPPYKHSATQKQWLRRQQGRLLNNQLHKVLKSLAHRLEPQKTTEAPVRAVYDYITTRVEHLDYLSTRKSSCLLFRVKWRVDTDM